MHRSEIRVEKKYEDKQRLRRQKFANTRSDSQSSKPSDGSAAQKLGHILR